jgi:hypothetical protein
MHAVGIALFLFATAVNVPYIQQAVFAPPPIISPDPAPPHPIKPRVPPPERPSAAVSAARVALEIARSALRAHGH